MGMRAAERCQRAGTLHSKHLIVSVYQQVMSSCSCCIIIALVFLCPVVFLSSACSTEFLWICLISCDVKTFSHNKAYHHSHAMDAWSYFLCLSLCVSSCSWPHVCIVHLMLFYRYMLQIGGFVFYEDVCTGDWQVNAAMISWRSDTCKSLLIPCLQLLPPINISALLAL